jgi:hypothetical protein
MTAPEFDEGSPRPERRQGSAQGEVQSDKSNAYRAQSVFAAEVLREFFNLLEEYAPVWYTEKHHDRAVVALRIMESIDETSSRSWA